MCSIINYVIVMTRHCAVRVCEEGGKEYNRYKDHTMEGNLQSFSRGDDIFCAICLEAEHCPWRRIFLIENIVKLFFVLMLSE